MFTENTLIVIKKIFLNMIMSIKQQIINLVEKYQTNNIKNRSYYFINDMINVKDSDSSLLKKNHTKILVFTTFDTSQLKRLMIIKIFIV